MISYSASFAGCRELGWVGAFEYKLLNDTLYFISVGYPIAVSMAVRVVALYMHLRGLQAQCEVRIMCSATFDLKKKRAFDVHGQDCLFSVINLPV